MEQYNYESQEENKKFNLKKYVCTSCNTNLDLSDSFCPECGTKVSKETSICRICSTNCNADYCDNCGASQISKQCGKCSFESMGDFCESCGEPLTEMAFKFLENNETGEEIEILSPIEAEDILREMESLLSPEVKRMQEKMKQRIILLKESEYFNQREDRIKTYQSGNRPKIKVVEPEELKKIQNQMKNFSGFLERQIKEKEEQERERELVRQKKEEEKVRIAEEKRQKKANRVSGLWVSTLGDSQITLDLREAQSGLGKAYINNIMMETIDILKVKWTGSKIEFHTTKIHVKWILPFLERVKIRFSGHVSEDGEMMTGFLSSAENWQEVFIKN